MKKKIIRIQERPRISVYRSNKFIYAQVIDDLKQTTLVAASDMKEKSKSKLERAAAVGEAIAKAATGKGIKKVWFDRGNYKYHGRIKALAEAARKGGLEF
jgi:large subunit ribosomal protein L18